MSPYADPEQEAAAAGLRHYWRDRRRGISAAHPTGETKQEYDRRRALWVNHEITPEQFDEMLARQGGRCAICGSSDPFKSNSKNGWSVDHDHKTGRIRGLLCHHCNILLGAARDNVEVLQRARSYLNFHDGGQ